VAARTKTLLGNPVRRIELDSFVNEQLRHALDALSAERFPTTGTASDQEFPKRVAAYEAAIRDIETIVILLARWADAEQLLQMEKILRRLAEIDKGGGGTVAWLRLNWYPLLVLMYAGGITALSTRRYPALYAMLATPVRANQTGAASRENPVALPVVMAISDIEEAFKLLPGHEKHRAPRSEHLYMRLKPILDDALFLGDSFGSLFDRFEAFLALAFIDFKNPNAKGRMWGPAGRLVYTHHSSESALNQLIEEAQQHKAAWPPLSAGLFGGQSERFLEVANGFKSMLDDRW
jgi:hypothetical protein